MANYTHEFSVFPNSIDALTHYEDMTDNDLAVINQYNKYLANNDVNSARGFLRSNPSINKKIISTDTINYMLESLRNMEIYSKSKKQGIYIQATEPTESVVHNDVWID